MRRVVNGVAESFVDLRSCLLQGTNNAGRDQSGLLWMRLQDGPLFIYLFICLFMVTRSHGTDVIISHFPLHLIIWYLPPTFPTRTPE
jgi:hypothetical protein